MGNIGRRSTKQSSGRSDYDQRAGGLFVRQMHQCQCANYQCWFRHVRLANKVVNIDRGETAEGALDTIGNQNRILLLHSRLGIANVKTGGLFWGWGFVI